MGTIGKWFKVARMNVLGTHVWSAQSTSLRNRNPHCRITYHKQKKCGNLTDIGASGVLNRGVCSQENKTKVKKSRSHSGCVIRNQKRADQ
jgi:hypothetical protein